MGAGKEVTQSWRKEDELELECLCCKEQKEFSLARVSDVCVGVLWEMQTFGEVPLEERSLILRETAPPGAPSEAGAAVSLWLPVLLLVLEAPCTWQSGVQWDKFV